MKFRFVKTNMSVAIARMVSAAVLVACGPREHVKRCRGYQVGCHGPQTAR